MEKITLLSAKMIRALGHSALTMFLFTVSILGVAINPVAATDLLKEDVYPGATSYKKGTMEWFGCEQIKVFSYQYRTKDAVAKVIEFYKNHGLTIVRDDSIYTCCISKQSYLMGHSNSGPDIYVTIEDFGFDEETGRFIDDISISIAFVARSDG
jgi:hypothetical protein